MRLVRMMPHHIAVIEAFMLLMACFVLTAQPVYAADSIRLQQRSLKVQKAIQGVTTDYQISFTYNTETSTGSIDMLFCYNPIPQDPCFAPAGLDLSNAQLVDQTGETGYSISLQTSNHIILSRPPAVVGQTPSSYTLRNVRNATVPISYAARLGTYASSDASGPVINLGSVVTQMTYEIFIETQVPPILKFCLSRRIGIDCDASDDVQYTDMGNLSPDETLTASSQMAVSTNASQGFSITVNGPPLQSGLNTIAGLKTPTPSQTGKPQFGINLRANTLPKTLGQDPDGSWITAQPTADYSVPDRYTYRDGDEIAGSPEVSMQRRFTVSYIVNVPENLRAGVYATSITYICSGRF
jgi:hypothetical protein